MIVAHVHFPVAMDRKALEEKMLSTAPKYEKLDGLIRKYYIVTEDGKSAGGIYLWESRAKAEAWYTEAWRQSLTAVWGAPPRLEYFDAPVVVDSARVHTRFIA